MKKLIVLLALNHIFIFIIFSSKVIKTHFQKKLLRKLEKRGENTDTNIAYKSNVVIDKVIYSLNSANNITNILSNISYIPLNCTIINEYFEAQAYHSQFICECNENFTCSDSSKVILYFKNQKLNYCNCKTIGIFQNNITLQCLCDIIFNCLGVNFFNGKCTPNITNREENSAYIYHILDQIENGYFKEIFTSAIEEDKVYIEIEYNTTYQISTVLSQYSTNLSIISLEECESKLKNVYSINENETLALLKLEHKIENAKIPIIEYQLFTIEGKKLNLSYCSEIEKRISIPVIINENEEFIHNPNSVFYQDRCYPYTSEYGTDMTLYIKRKNFNEKFLALCEKICTYIEYNFTNKNAICGCKTKTTFPNNSTEELNAKELLIQFVDFKKIFSNVYILTCYEELFSSKGMKKNSGSYINIIIIVTGSILTILFCIRGYNSFKKKINDIIRAKFRNYKEEQNVTGGACGIETELNINIDPNLNLGNQIGKNSDKNLNLTKPNFYNDYEINNLEYSEALEIDKRTFWESYISLIKTKHIIFFTFFIKNDYNSTEIKLCLFLFWLALDYLMNALFFNDSTMNKINEDKGKFNLLYQLQISIYSFIITFIITNIIKLFAIFEGTIAEKVKIKTSETEKNINNYILSIKWKFIIFFSLILLLFFLFWYYLSCFCAVFINTQKPLIKDTIIGYAIGLFYPFIIGIIFCGFRLCALKAKNKDRVGLYNASNCLGNVFL